MDYIHNIYDDQGLIFHFIQHSIPIHLLETKISNSNK
jgi:hypothetical protein